MTYEYALEITDWEHTILKGWAEQEDLLGRAVAKLWDGSRHVWGGSADETFSDDLWTLWTLWVSETAAWDFATTLPILSGDFPSGSSEANLAATLTAFAERVD